MVDFIELIELQEEISARVGHLTHWVRVEVESHREVRGHHYFKFLQKLPDGQTVARADGRLWSSRSFVLEEFFRLTGRRVDSGISVVVSVVTEYHPVYGLSLIINDIDPSYTIGQREIELKKTIGRLNSEGYMERQRSLGLPFLPARIAVISSRDAAGYGDFVRHLSENDRGFRFDCTLLQALMQGDSAPSSINACLNSVADFDIVLILRGGGAEADLFCYDDYELCKSIALCGIPVLTAIGHERDRHIADLVAFESFKTPTALADFLIDWVRDVEDEMDGIADGIARIVLDRIFLERSCLDNLLSGIRFHLSSRVRSLDDEVARCTSNICFALSARLNAMEGFVNILDAGIKSADPRGILSQGYVLAVDSEGRIVKSAASGSEGSKFSLRFRDGMWKCGLDEVKLLSDR